MWRRSNNEINRQAVGDFAITGSFAPVTYQFFRFEGIGTSGGARLLEIGAVGVPEPASLALLAAGPGVAGVLRRRRRPAA